MGQPAGVHRTGVQGFELTHHQNLMLMNFDLDKNPAYKGLTYATDIGCIIGILGGVYGLILAQRQIRRGEERLGRQSRKQAITFICIGIGYFLLRRFGNA